MKNERWLVYGIGFLVFSGLILWMIVRSQDMAVVSEQQEETQAIRSTLVDTALMDTADIKARDGTRWIIGRKHGESDVEFVLRVARLLSGEEHAGPCWESECDVGHVKLCVACMVGESQAACQARLDALVAAWCAEHECDECP